MKKPTPASQGARPHWHGADRDEHLVRFANDGLTATHIIAKFDGSPTRNSIIGRVHRLQKKGIKISLSGGEHANSGPRKDKKPKKVPPKPSTRIEASAGWRGDANAHHNDFKARAEQRAASPGLRPELIEGVPLRPELLPSTNVVPISRKLALVDLQRGECKWPQGDPLAADFGFCGHPAGDRPYCNYHSRLAFTPVAQRRQQTPERTTRRG